MVVEGLLVLESITVSALLPVFLLKHLEIPLITIDCLLCPQDEAVVYCSGCYSGVHGYCPKRDHPLVPWEFFLEEKCRTAYDPDRSRVCNSLNCGKKISGLYFRESHMNASQDPSNSSTPQTVVYATTTTLIFVCNVSWVVVDVTTRTIFFQGA
jgi:hypothetical protein